MIASLSLPLSAFELQDAVRCARRYDPSRLDRILRLEPERDQLEVQAGASWASVAARIGTPGEAAALAACPFSVAKSVAMNVPGPDGAPIVAHVESLTLVMPEGELRRVSRHNFPKLFALAVGGQGLFGVPYSITLRVESLLRAVRACASAEALALSSRGAKRGALELFVPPAVAQRFLADVRELCADWRMPLQGVEVRRTFAEEETFLRWARCEYAAVTLDVEAPHTLGGSVRSAQFRRALVDAAIARGGSFAIASTRDATREQAEACYPELKTLLAEKHRLDPEEKVTSTWFRHYRSLFGRESCAVRWNR